MIFRVRIGYYDFDIQDDKTALSFAELAKNYIVQDDDRKIGVDISLIDEEVAADE